MSEHIDQAAEEELRTLQAKLEGQGVMFLDEKTMRCTDGTILRYDDVKFPLGRTVITPAALGKLTPEDIDRAITRHVAGDWGEVDEHDRRENEFALNKRLRLMSVYRAANGTKFWIITEADRSATTVLLPEDY